MLYQLSYARVLPGSVAAPKSLVQGLAKRSRGSDD